MIVADHVAFTNRECSGQGIQVIPCPPSLLLNRYAQQLARTQMNAIDVLLSRFYISCYRLLALKKRDLFLTQARSRRYRLGIGDSCVRSREGDFTMEK